MQENPKTNKTIEDYILIGDLHSSALVSKSASIDWLCWPKFDSPSIFAKLLDDDSGHFRLNVDELEIESSYTPNTAIANFNCKRDGLEFSLFDYMIPQPLINCAHHYLVRKIKCLKGSGSVEFNFSPKTNYGREQIEPQIDGERIIYTLGEGYQMYLTLPSGTIFERNANDSWNIAIHVEQNSEYYLILEYTLPDEHPAYPIMDSYKFTEKFWLDWLKGGNFYEFKKDQVKRSAITLKLLQYYPTGALVAAPTTSLPEAIGGQRNWDYRYTWIRDSTFTLYAFYVLGLQEEAERYFKFVDNIVRKERKDGTDLALMYTVESQRVEQEYALDHLEGYKNSKPVRVGNNASAQFQLDTYGILLDSFYFMSKHDYIDINDYRDTVRYLADLIVEQWQRKDNGIWEVRAKHQDYTYSKVICWVGLDRLIRMKDKLKIPEEQVVLYQEVADRIKKWVWENCYDSERQIFKMHPNTNNQDATNLLLAPLQFLDRHDPLTKIIINNTHKELRDRHGFMYRYKMDDGFKSSEGIFILCSYWLVASLACVEEYDEAKLIFDKLENIQNPYNLMSEEYDVDAQMYLGNYPQAFSHIGYIFSSYYLQKYKP